MFKKYLLILIFSITSAQTCFAGKAGKTGWSIFRKARSAKFKPITVTPVMAVRGDLTGVFYNPAVLSMNMYKEIFLLSELGLTDDIFGGVVYGHPLKKAGIAAGLIYYDAGKMDLNWLEGGKLITQNVSAQRDLLGILSYGRKFGNKLALGLTVKAATSRLFEKASASAFAGDFGFLYMPPIEKLTISGAIQNFGSSSKFVDKANPLPFSAFLAAGYLLEINKYYLASGVDVTYLFDEDRMIPELGFEFGLDPVSINTGYRFNVEEGIWHLGFTWYKEKYDIAYGYLPGIRLASTHRLSIGYRF